MRRRGVYVRRSELRRPRGAAWIPVQGPRPPCRGAFSLVVRARAPPPRRAEQRAAGVPRRFRAGPHHHAAPVRSLPPALRGGADADALRPCEPGHPRRRRRLAGARGAPLPREGRVGERGARAEVEPGERRRGAHRRGLSRRRNEGRAPRHHGALRRRPGGDRRGAGPPELQEHAPAVRAGARARLPRVRADGVQRPPAPEGLRGRGAARGEGAGAGARAEQEGGGAGGREGGARRRRVQAGRGGGGRWSRSPCCSFCCSCR